MRVGGRSIDRQTKRNETKRNETKRNETKRNDINLLRPTIDSLVDYQIDLVESRGSTAIGRRRTAHGQRALSDRAWSNRLLFRARDDTDDKHTRKRIRCIPAGGAKQNKKEQNKQTSERNNRFRCLQTRAPRLDPSRLQGLSRRIGPPRSPG